MNAGDTVRMKAAEGELRVGERGVLIGSYQHQSGDLLVVRFEKSTRVVHASSVEAFDRNGQPIGS